MPSIISHETRSHHLLVEYDALTQLDKALIHRHGDFEGARVGLSYLPISGYRYVVLFMLCLDAVESIERRQETRKQQLSRLNSWRLVRKSDSTYKYAVVGAIGVHSLRPYYA